MQYDALTFDTQTVMANGFHFDRGLLAQLKQFKDGLIKVVVSEVVIQETLKHLTENTASAKNSMEAAHRKAVEHGLLPVDIGPAFDGAASTPKNLAQKRIEGFLRSIGAEICKAELAPMGELVRLYFKAAPPFSTSGKKKNEFPDAIALLSLEAWAADRGQKILAVTRDGDWASYAHNSARIDVVKDLDEALALLQKHAEEAEAAVQRILSDMQNGKHRELAEYFREKLVNEVSTHPIDGYAESGYDTELEHLDLTLLEFNFIGDLDTYDFAVIQIVPHKVVVRIPIEISVNADASFSFSIYDSIDKDYLRMGSVEVQREKYFEAGVLVTFEGNLDIGDVEITEVELVDAPASMDFGYLEPDYSEYEHDDED